MLGVLKPQAANQNSSPSVLVKNNTVAHPEPIKATPPSTSTLFLPPPPEDIRDGFANVAGYPEDIGLIKQALSKYAIDPMYPNKKGHTAFHSAALGGNPAFFELMFNDPRFKAKLDINVFDSEKATPLSCAIRGNHFELAFKLIRVYKADINVIVKSSRPADKKDDDSSSILRVAFVKYFSTTFDKLTTDQKLQLEELCQELVTRGLKFFNSPGTSCPPSIEITYSNLNGNRDDDKKFMKEMNWNEKEYNLYLNLKDLKKCSGIVFNLLISEAEKIKFTNPEAQEILKVWNKHLLKVAPNNLKPNVSLK